MTIRSIFSIQESKASYIIRNRYDHRSSLQKIVDFAVSWLRQAEYSIAVFVHRWCYLDPKQCGNAIEWEVGNTGLIVMVHGLRNYPSAWHRQLSILRNRLDIAVFTPNVYLKGMCSVEEASRPIFFAVLEYTQHNVGKPVCFLGTSNGGRIATWCETELRIHSPQTPVKVSSIAGAHFGSRQMNLLEYLGLARFFYHNVLRNELKYGSDIARGLLGKVKASLPTICAPRSYEFYATTEDITIPDFDSSLPSLNIGEELHVVHGQSHSSIVSAVAEQQIRSCLRWMNRFQ